MNSDKTLAKMLGSGTTQAAKRVNTSAAVAKLLFTVAGAIGGNVAGRVWPTDMFGGAKYSPVAGTIVGAASGYTLGSLAERIARFKADMQKADTKDIKSHYSNTPVEAYLIPGYSAYYKQQLENRSSDEALMKKGSVLSEDDVRKYREMAAKYGLAGRKIMDEYDDKQIVALANGIGPSSWSDSVVKVLNKLNPYAVPAAIIHDLEWSRGINNKDRFHASNARFKNNIDKVVNGMKWYNPLKYTAYLNSGLMKSLVDTNFKHYREGLATAREAYLNARSKNISEALDRNRKYLTDSGNIPVAEKYQVLKRMIEKADTNARYSSGYTLRTA